MKRADKRISYLLDREAMVTVEAEKDFKAFWQQRLRWAGKMRGVRSAGSWSGAIALSLPFFLLYATCSFSIREAAGQGLFRSALLLLSAWLLWLLSVIGLVREAKKFLGARHSAFGAVFSFLAFSIYAPVIAVVALFVRPKWKGRTIH